MYNYTITYKQQKQTNSLCAMQACGCALLALSSLLPSLPALSK